MSPNRKEYQRAYYEAHKERIRVQKRAWQAKQKKKAAAKRDDQKNTTSIVPQEAAKSKPDIDQAFLMTRRVSGPGTPTVAICHLDCFNCPFPDCKAGGKDILTYNRYLADTGQDDGRYISTDDVHKDRSAGDGVKRGRLAYGHYDSLQSRGFPI